MSLFLLLNAIIETFSYIQIHPKQANRNVAPAKVYDYAMQSCTVPCTVILTIAAKLL